LLIEKRGQLVEKRELIDVVWGGTFVTDNALTRVIAQLRKALGDDAKESRYIGTVPTRGYRFISEVISEESAVDDPPVLETSSTSSTQESSKPAVESKRRGKPRTVVAVGSLSLVLLVMTGIGLVRWTSRSKVLQIANNTQITTGSSLFIYPT